MVGGGHPVRGGGGGGRGWSVPENPALGRAGPNLQTENCTMRASSHFCLLCTRERLGLSVSGEMGGTHLDGVRVDVALATNLRVLPHREPVGVHTAAEPCDGQSVVWLQHKPVLAGSWGVQLRLVRPHCAQHSALHRCCTPNTPYLGAAAKGFHNKRLLLGCG